MPEMVGGILALTVSYKVNKNAMQSISVFLNFSVQKNTIGAIMAYLPEGMPRYSLECKICTFVNQYLHNTWKQLGGLGKIEPF